MRRPISAFAVRCLDSIKPILAKSKISGLQLASEAEHASLSLTTSQTPKTGFLVTWLKWNKKKLQRKNHNSGLSGTDKENI